MSRGDKSRPFTGQSDRFFCDHNASQSNPRGLLLSLRWYDSSKIFMKAILARGHPPTTTFSAKRDDSSLSFRSVSAAIPSWTLSPYQQDAMCLGSCECQYLKPGRCLQKFQLIESRLKYSRGKPRTNNSNTDGRVPRNSQDIDCYGRRAANACSIERRHFRQVAYAAVPRLEGSNLRQPAIGHYQPYGTRIGNWIPSKSP